MSNFDRSWEMTPNIPSAFATVTTVAVVSVGLAGNGSDRTSERAVEALRESVAPDAFGKVPGEENEWTRQPERKAQ